ncbi:MAG: hypothetical protein KDI87_00530 [Gammaproteobacteria bacterium]|nr:hypothetical protein [Gammaproteobacteria bacterium]MCP5139684.1 hypothetical protein [Chromatiales bacterium]
MATQDNSPPRRRATDSDTDVSSTGWDPYIVELIGAASQSVAGEAAANTATEIVEGRKIQLMAWLHAHNR